MMTQGWFGSAVALSADGSTLVVSAPTEGLKTEGAVYVFRRLATTWTQDVRLAGSGGSFGHGIAISGDGTTLAIGAYGEDSTGVGAEFAGTVHVFVRGASGWSEQAKLRGVNTEAFDYFGWSVALASHGDTLAVGAFGESGGAAGVDGNARDNSKPRSGAAYVFARSGALWTQQAYVKASNPDVDDGFGTSIALAADGATLAVGAPVESSVATGIDGDQTSNAAGAAGAVYTYARSGATWAQTAYIKGAHIGGPPKLDAGGAASGDRVGASVAFSGDGARLAIGAPGDSGETGAAYVLTRAASSWVFAYIARAPGGESGDHAGGAVAIADAALVLGAVEEASAARGIGGDPGDNSAPDSGAAYVFAAP
jgi:hypothetical protein